MHSVIAATLGLSTSELSEYRYQKTKHKSAVYCIGNDYFACGIDQPQTPGLTWALHADQFFAERKNTKLWIGSPNE